MANIVLAYICWLIGGPLGLHHFYLGRDRQAFVWWMSLGGLFLGWFRDLWRLPEYVYEANSDPAFHAELKSRQSFRPKPPFSIVRFAGQLFIGLIMGYLCRLVIPEKLLVIMDPVLRRILTVVLPVLGTAIGVSLVGNIGHRKVSFKWCLIGSALSIPWLLQDEPSLATAALISSVAATWKVEWDPDRKPPKGACKCISRVFVLTICGCIYIAMWTSVIVYNVHVTSNDGMQIPISEAVENFFNSPAWKDFKKTLFGLYEFCQVNGWDHCYQQLMEQIDPTGESHAYKVLEFEPGESPTPKDIQSRCRKLGRDWHPDKFKTESEKISAQEKFIEIQKACDILNEMRKRRSDKNMKSDTSRKEKTRQHKHTEF